MMLAERRWASLEQAATRMARAAEARGEEDRVGGMTRSVEV